MAEELVKTKKISVQKAYTIVGISSSCYRYKPKLSDENKLIADWLMRITDNQKNWGFVLCFLYLRNVKGFFGTISVFIEYIENLSLICVLNQRKD